MLRGELKSREFSADQVMVLFLQKGFAEDTTLDAIQEFFDNYGKVGYSIDSHLVVTITLMLGGAYSNEEKRFRDKAVYGMYDVMMMSLL